MIAATPDIYFQVFFTTLALAFGVIHLMMFGFGRDGRTRSHLYFALFAFNYAASIFLDYQAAITGPDQALSLAFLHVHRALLPFNVILMLLFLYSVFRIPRPRYFWAMLAVMLGFGAWAAMEPIRALDYLQLALLTGILEILRLLIIGIRRQEEGAVLISSGMGFLILFSSYDFLLDLGLMSPIDGIHNGYPFGFLGLLFCMSIYLARDFAQAHRRIIEQDRHAQRLETEQKMLAEADERKSKELEEARQLQLSMLPDEQADIPGYDLCFFMRTASEVGGDYYDYHYDGETLTLAVGDATGHGTRAGILVAVVKSLFIALDPDDDIPSFFKRCSVTIRKMRLGTLFMGLQLIRIRGLHIVAGSAGMPPFLVHRAVDGQVEEYLIKGLPLGGSPRFPYQTRELELQPGDTLLMMSDGLAEEFNPEGEMLDYARVREWFGSLARYDTDQIAGKLADLGTRWRAGREQSDDLTFALLRVR